MIILKETEEHIHFIVEADLDRMLANGMTLLQLLKDDISRNQDKSGWIKLNYDIDTISKELLKVNKLSLNEVNKWRVKANLSPISLEP